MSYSDTFRAYLRTPGFRVFPVLEIAFPDVTRKLTSVGSGVVDSEPRVVEAGWGPIARGVSEFSAELAPLEITVQIADDNRDYERLLEGQYDCRGSAASIYLATPDLDSAEWPNRFVGILDAWSYQPGAVTLELRSDDRNLQSKVPKVPFGKSQFQLRNHTASSEGLWAPLIFGKHDSSGLTGTGLIPLIPVDWSSGAEAIYAVSLGTCSAVPVVYKNGVIVGSGFSVVTANYGGSAFTVVDFSSSYPLAGDVLTADVDGYDADGTGSGALLTNPVHQLWTFLDQFVWGDQRTWSTDTFGYDNGNAPVDATSWNATAAKFALYSLKGSRYIGGSGDRDRAIDWVNEWLQSFPFVRLHWNATGNLVMSDLLPEHPGYGVSTDPILERDELIGGVSTLGYNATDIVKRITTQCLYDTAASSFVGSIDAQDLNVSEDVADEIPCFWYESSA